MGTIEVTAPGKIILFGEHAVVYGRPALAAPVTQLRARAVVEQTDGREVRLLAPDLGRETTLAAAPADNPLALAARLVEETAGQPIPPGTVLRVSSEIPIAGGLGSGAAIAVTVIRALAQHLGMMWARELVSALAFRVEQLHHGTPSGIDNTVVAYEQPVYFVRGPSSLRIEPFAVTRPLRLVIADSGVRSSTREVVEDVRLRWQQNRRGFEKLFDACGRVAEAGRAALAAGDIAQVGDLMTENHRYLREMTVSSTDLDSLVGRALAEGALGAKLSGAGRGGNVIALVTEETEGRVAAAMARYSGSRIYRSSVG